MSLQILKFYYKIIGIKFDILSWNDLKYDAFNYNAYTTCVVQYTTVTQPLHVVNDLPDHMYTLSVFVHLKTKGIYNLNLSKIFPGL